MVEEDVVKVTSRYLRRSEDQIEEIYETLGIETLNDLAASQPSEIAEAFGISEKTAKNIVRDARKEASKGIAEPKTLAELMEEEAERDVIPTGIDSFDEQMGGGLPTKTIVGIYGPPGAGKSQFAMQVAARVLKEGESVLYIDTENAFRPQRLLEIGGFDEDDVKKKIGDRFVLRQIVEAAALTQYFDEEEGEFVSEALELSPKVVVIDSISQPFRPYGARDKLPERSRMVARILNSLLKYCTRNNALGLVTTHVQANPDAFGKRWQDVAPTVLKHIATYRFSIEFKGRTERVIALEDAPDKPPFEVKVKLTDRGLVG